MPVCSCRFSRAILPHIFSCLAGAQFVVCIIYFTLQTFLFCFQQTVAFSPVQLCLNLDTSEHFSRPCCNVFIAVYSHRPNRATMDCHLKGSVPLCCARAIRFPIYLFVGTHSCLFDPVQAPPTSHLN